MDDEYRTWKCPLCGHEVIAVERPNPIRWTDGHRCFFVENKDDEDC